MTSRGILFPILLTAAWSLHADVLVSSNWDNPADGVDGWSFVADGTGFMRVATGGNPGGFLQISDLGTGGVIFFDAAAKFLGNQSAAYGGTLSYNLQQSTADRPSSGDIPEVLLSNPTTTLAFDLPNSSNPAVTPQWSAYTFVLLASAGWFDFDTNLPATEAQMKAVLSNLTDLEIRAEYSAARDVDGLDNVVLASVPEPASAGLLLSAVLMFLLRWRMGGHRAGTPTR